MALRLVGVMTWLGGRDFEGDLATGRYQQAIATMITRYLVAPEVLLAETRAPSDGNVPPPPHALVPAAESES